MGRTTMYFLKVYELAGLLQPEIWFPRALSFVSKQKSQAGIPLGLELSHSWAAIHIWTCKWWRAMPECAAWSLSPNGHVWNFRASNICKENKLTCLMQAGEKKRKTRINEIMLAKLHTHRFTPGVVNISLDFFFSLVTRLEEESMNLVISEKPRRTVGGGWHPWAGNPASTALATGQG